MKILGQFPPQLSIKARLTLVTLGLFLVAIWVLVVGAAGQFEKKLAETLSDEQFSAVSYIAADIDGDLLQRIDILQADADGITTALLSDPQAAARYLADRHALNSMFKLGAILISKEGRALAAYPATSERLQFTRFSDFEYFTDVLASGKWAIGKARIGAVTKQPLIAMAAPVKNDRGQTAAVLVAYAALSDHLLFGPIEGMSIGKSGYIAVADPKYRLIIASSDPRNPDADQWHHRHDQLGLGNPPG